MNKKIPIMIAIFFMLSLNISAESIEFDIHTSSLNAIASFSQNGFSALETINNEVAASGQADSSKPGVPNAYDGWAVAPHHAENNHIMWSFQAGSTGVNAIQILSVYNANEIIHTFSLEYTTDSNPDLNSTFHSITSISATDGNTGNVLNPIITGNLINLSATPKRNYKIYFNAINATGIRLNSVPYAGTGNGNFVISEVSFQSAAAPEPSSWMLLLATIGLLSSLRRKSKF